MSLKLELDTPHEVELQSQTGEKAEVTDSERFLEHQISCPEASVGVDTGTQEKMIWLLGIPTVPVCDLHITRPNDNCGIPIIHHTQYYIRFRGHTRTYALACTHTKPSTQLRSGRLVDFIYMTQEFLP